MRKTKAKAIKKIVRAECVERKVPFSTKMYRRAKKGYNEMPRTYRHTVA